MNKYIDYKPEEIQAKLQQCLDYEAKYGANTVTKAWTKWCNSYEYRKNEWQFRQNVAKYVEYGRYRYTAS